MNSNEKNTATFIHLSSLTQYFIPFGNFIIPLLLWNSKKNDSEFVDCNGKQVLNFQLSILVYTLVIAIISIPIIIINVLKIIPLESFNTNEEFLCEQLKIVDFSGTLLFAIMAIILLIGLKITEFFLIIYASLKASNGDKFNYPLTIPFLK
jgi:uncharacterized protein